MESTYLPNMGMFKSEEDKSCIFCTIAKLVLFLAVIVVSFWVGRMRSETVFVSTDSCDYYSKTVLNWENVDYWIAEFGIKEPDIVKAQIKLETNDLKSKVCRQNNNLFGFKMPEIRETTATHKEGSYASYPNFIESIKDYSIFQRRAYNGTENYYQFLQRVGYAEDTMYLRKLKQIVYARRND